MLTEPLLWSGKLLVIEGIGGHLARRYSSSACVSTEGRRAAIGTPLRTSGRTALCVFAFGGYPGRNLLECFGGIVQQCGKPGEHAWDVHLVRFIR